ncbi:cysteine-rich receptor-like protein kinase 10 [Quercus suber]|uniref:Cysteine-rich receptor-like protein kinase 10 n=1 Tax=Quercus suber TaxID=58331 RepID=A0AAW0JH25_QUESU
MPHATLNSTTPLLGTPWTLFLSHTRTEAVATYVHHNCPNTTTFTTNSTYQSNLNNLLTYLSSNATRNIEFYNATAGNSVDTATKYFGQIRFDQLVRPKMSGLASRIINLSTGAKKFGTKQVNFTALKHVYTLVQCTPDLSGYDCTRCLRLAMKKLPSGNKRGRVLFPSCNAMFEVYPFYLTGNTSTPLPMPVPPPPTPKADQKLS